MFKEENVNAMTFLVILFLILLFCCVAFALAPMDCGPYMHKCCQPGNPLGCHCVSTDLGCPPGETEAPKGR